jgi:glycerate kinase
MRILIAPDKFKGTLTARQAAEAIAAGWRRARPDDQLTLLPISDGGDGFGLVLGDLLRAKPQTIRTVNAAHRPVRATWWWQPKSHTAIIESANIIGLAMLPKGKFHPFALDTFGVGAAVNAARQKGARRIILGIGGSATNDGGFGLARALGWKFLNRTGAEITKWTELTELKSVQRPAGFPKGLIQVAVDVQNPLLGRRGATRIYGPQKGIRPADIIPAEKCLRRMAQVVKRQLGLDFAKTPGTGAAGGLGFGLATFANATLASGFDLFAQQAGLSRLLAKADLIVTAEGSMDRSTLMGKGAGEMARRGRAQKIPLVGLAGVVREPELLRTLFVSVHALTDLTTPADAQRRAKYWLTQLAFQTAKKLRTGKQQSGLASAQTVAKLTA